MITSQENQDEKLLDDILHRIDLLKKVDKRIKLQNMKQELRLIKQKEVIGKELTTAKEDIIELKQTISSLRKSIFILGSKLKQKVVKKELEEVDSRINALNFESLVTRKELPEMYEQYAK